MIRSETLTQALDAATARADGGYSHLVQEKDPVKFFSYAETARRARRFGAALQAAGVRPGERVGLILPDSSEFVEAIYGAMYAGAIAVPVYPPMNLGQFEGYLANTTHILRQAGCSLVVTDGKVRPILGRLMSNVPSVRAVEVYASFVKQVDERAAPIGVDVKPDDVAFLQFTSGSTSRPKGVTLTHANLIANVYALGAGLNTSEDTYGLSWLPLYHDMGLIGFVFTPAVLQVRGVQFMSPLLFLKRPALWLRQLSERKAHVSFAPNFAYGLCTARIKDHELQGVDLSHLRVAGCGAEPIQYDTLNAFAERFAAWGFRRTAFLPCYGMAEHSLAVTFVGLDEDLRADKVDADALVHGEAKPSEADDALKVVCCGRTFPGHELRIVDAEGNPLPERRVGQIELRGPSVMRGYWGDAERTLQVLRDGWLATGDLGYLVDGELYVCGRIKDLIIIHGRNYYPQDLEWQASQVEGVRKGNVVAFGIEDASLGRERVIVAAEVRTPHADDLRDKIAAKILETLALKPDEIVLLPPGSLPKTSSGKLQRNKTSELYRDGQLGKGAVKAGTIDVIKHLATSRWSYIRAAFGSRDAED
ncbi:Acyl-CoA synthetase (AMP-forming)/AMP-acid ligase II [Nannocystis exedens]|uniref:Acyl-CoA synthetase (AMP-forming)/AMP-acid ligase II n=1 Tax=Nannocystis exedens TaxID=54 RepID=A0A1I1X8Z4_9BACT|nr:fatty acyl-AMP ligase [Nannocystis exedens]PCC70737.1 AMP-dependent synthetase [Nannocystis exedens]SFE03817.1 Acyl-CoA synthetase (AMP-forming)/AMP-acid ligase II [Nannocystis exedens]